VTTAALLACAGCASAPAPAPPQAAPLQTPHQTTPTAGASRIVTIGDSIMAGYGLDPDQAWPALLAAEGDATVTNLGCSGAGFVADGDCGVPFAGLIDAAVAAHPALVIIQSSDNDDGEDEATLADATMSTVVALHDALPAARIVGLSTLWNQDEDAPDEVESSTRALESAIAAVGGAFVDIGQPLQGNSDYLQWDDEHPTAAGQEALLSAIGSAFAGAGIAL